MYRVYIDESGNPKDNFYVVTAVVLKRGVRAEEVARKIIDTSLESSMKSIVPRILYESGELKGKNLNKKIKDYNKRNPNNTLSIYDVGSWLSKLLKDNVSSIRSVIIGTKAFRKLFVSFRDALIEHVKRDIRNALTKSPSQLAYFSILATDSISEWLLKEPINDIFFKLLRIQAIHEVLPRTLLDIGDQNRGKVKPDDIMIFIDRDYEEKAGTKGIYNAYLRALQEVIDKKKALPQFMVETLSKIYDQGIDRAYAIPSHCEKLRILGRYVNNYYLCNTCNYEICPSGIWLADIVSYIISKCLNGNSSYCEVVKMICNDLQSIREQSFGLFVIPRESKPDVVKKLDECVQ